jgi:putative endonuclease
MFSVYILRCADGSYYTGHTDNLDARLHQHNNTEQNSYVSSRKPFKLIWTETFETRELALTAELQIKGWSRKKKEAMMQGNWMQVSALARSKNNKLA